MPRKIVIFQKIFVNIFVFVDVFPVTKHRADTRTSNNKICQYTGQSKLPMYLSLESRFGHLVIVYKFPKAYYNLEIGFYLQYKRD
jgi:hypothetical protein